MADRRSGHKPCALHLGRVDNGGRLVWRPMLEEAGTKRQRSFDGLNAMQTFLADLITEQDEAQSLARPAGSGSHLSETLAGEDDS